MGQFYSREFDGDPYIDLMRSLPERELIWWAQKVIWLAEGFTFVDHFTRTYPRLFQHTCPRCKGAGVLTCPTCAGTKVPRGVTPSPRRAALAAVGANATSSAPAPALAGRVDRGAGSARERLLSGKPAGGGGGSESGSCCSGEHAGGRLGECRTCGGSCAWDAESEWMDKWNEWEGRLAYYDKSTAPLLDEWYEDVVHAGNLEEDTPPLEDDPPGPEVAGAWADDERLLAKDKKRFAALMRRYGHPYDSDLVLGYQVVDPTATVGENVWNLAQALNSVPPELNPLRTEHLRGAEQLAAAGAGAGAAGGGEPAGPHQASLAALAAFDREITMEAAIMQNLEAAAQDLPKPHRFGATAGTIPCTDCDGAAWQYSFFPNTLRLFGMERPSWTTTLAQLNKYWNPTSLADPDRTGHMLPYGEHGLRTLLATPGGSDPLEAFVGPKPKTTRRYRHDLQLLVQQPQLRDSRLRVAPGLRNLGEHLDWA
ncbi:hypothetical protein Agub_g11169, partial [Astrephomene gubernaculifera]